MADLPFVWPSAERQKDHKNDDLPLNMIQHHHQISRERHGIKSWKGTSRGMWPTLKTSRGNLARCVNAEVALAACFNINTWSFHINHEPLVFNGIPLSGKASFTLKRGPGYAPTKSFDAMIYVHSPDKKKMTCYPWISTGETHTRDHACNRLRYTGTVTYQTLTGL